MGKHSMSESWNQKEFDHLFELFEEDEVTKKAHDHEKIHGEDGLDRNEFKKLVKRIAQL